MSRSQVIWAVDISSVHDYIGCRLCNNHVRGIIAGRERRKPLKLIIPTFIRAAKGTLKVGHSIGNKLIFMNHGAMGSMLAGRASTYRTFCGFSSHVYRCHCV